MMETLDGSSGEGDDQMARNIWKIIAYKGQPYDHDKSSTLKFFARLCQSIDHDQTFQKVLRRTQALRDDDHHLTFK